MFFKTKMKDNTPYIIAGPTASGKTDIALRLAQTLGGAVISADSRQIYKTLTAGTAAPHGVWDSGIYKVDGVPYHLVDFLDIKENYDISKFAASAADIVAASGNKPCIFAGGSGMYLQGYFGGLDALPKADAKIRAELSALAQREGKEYLHNMLKEKDALSAAAIPPGNIHRVIRALEIFMLTGKPASVLRRSGPVDISAGCVKFIYIDWDKDILNARIESRTKLIFEPMTEEARRALNAGYNADCAGLKSLGYREAIACLNGEITKDYALERIITLTRQYAKRQRTWFSRYANMIKINIKSASEFDVDFIAAKIAK